MDILNLPHLKVIDVKENEFDYGIHAESTIDEVRCPQCGFAELYKHGVLKQMFWDIPIHAKRTGIHIKRQRYKCKQCSSTFMEELPDMDNVRTMTIRLVEYIEQQSLKKTFTSLSEEIGVNEKTIRNVFNEYVERLEAKYTVSTPRWLGIDEVHLLKKMRFVMTDIENRTVLDIARRRDKDSVIRELMKLKDRDKIEVVTMDMWRPYKDAVNTVLPQAKIVIDKFHIVKEANKSLDDARIANRKELQGKEKKQLFRDRYILRKRRHSLDDSEKLILEVWTSQYSILKMAYEAKESLFEVYDNDNWYDAMKALEEWKSTLPKEVKPYFKDLLKSLNNWEEEILNYFSNHRLTNAYTESLNGLIKVMYRMGRGYSFEALRAKILFTSGVRKFGKPKYAKEDLSPNRQLTVGLPNIDWDNFFKEPKDVDMGADISTIVKLFEEGKL